MKTKWTKFLYGVVVTAVIVLTACPLVAAPPTGEVKTADSQFGAEVPIPFFESAFGGDYINMLYDHLVGTTPEGKYSPDNGLATKWEMSPDGLTWTFYLRKGIKFHDGVELTAKDVKFSIERLVIPGYSPSASAVDIRRVVKSVEVKDPYTVVVQCKKPDIFLPTLLSGIEGPAGMVTPKDYFEKVGKDEFAKHPIGSGPYKWHSQRIGSFIKLEATDKHWRDGVPKYKYMTYLIIPEETTRIAMLKTGEADIARISRGAAKEVPGAGLNIVTKENIAVLAFRANKQWLSPVFSDIRFRKALNLAIDKESIIKHLLGGLAKPIAAWPGSAIAGIGGDPTLKPYPYDPQEARRLIKEGGWEGYEFPLLTYQRAVFPELHLVVEALVGYWQKIGLKPKIRMGEWNTFMAAWRTGSRELENTIHGHDSSTTPGVASLVARATERYYFKQPTSAVNIPELNEKFERIEKSLDIAEISRLLVEVYNYDYDQHLNIPICEISDITATTKRIPKWNMGLRRFERNYYDLIKQQ